MGPTPDPSPREGNSRTGPGSPHPDLPPVEEGHQQHRPLLLHNTFCTPSGFLVAFFFLVTSSRITFHRLLRRTLVRSVSLLSSEPTPERSVASKVQWMHKSLSPKNTSSFAPSLCTNTTLPALKRRQLSNYKTFRNKMPLSSKSPLQWDRGLNKTHVPFYPALFAGNVRCAGWVPL